MFHSSNGFLLFLLNGLLIASSFRSTSALLTPVPTSTQHRSNLALSMSRSSSTVEERVTIRDPTTTIPLTIQPTREDSMERRKRNQGAEKYEEQLWEVKVYNDNVNTHEWVARCLVLIVAQTEWQAYQTTKMAHQQGEACLGVWEKELASRYVDGLVQQGLVVDMFPVHHGFQ